MVQSPFCMVYPKFMTVLADDAIPAFKSLVIEAVPHGRSVRRMGPMGQLGGIRSTFKLFQNFWVYLRDIQKFIKIYQEYHMISYDFSLFLGFKRFSSWILQRFKRLLAISSRWPQQESASASSEILLSDLHQLQDVLGAEAPWWDMVSKWLATG